MTKGGLNPDFRCLENSSGYRGSNQGRGISMTELAGRGRGLKCLFEMRVPNLAAHMRVTVFRRVIFFI